jgi:hypothetical protein
LINLIILSFFAQLRFFRLYRDIYIQRNSLLKCKDCVNLLFTKRKLHILFDNLKFTKLIHIKNKSFKNLCISSLYKLRLCKNRFLIRSTRICVYIILILKLNVNSFSYIYIHSALNLKRSEDVAFDKIKYFCCRLLRSTKFFIV